MQALHILAHPPSPFIASPNNPRPLHNLIHTFDTCITSFSLTSTINLIFKFVQSVNVKFNNTTTNDEDDGNG
tara:strand:+ start:839 stop:1054 length:216 start_codon:yes stop_codon:yes gene_type:complete